ncbi:MAG TPA: DUF2007 domain-containing protein [Nitrospiria bacterium]|nr:DUF2007 domain-containing protein [Nitrospiria bacterium]
MKRIKLVLNEVQWALAKEILAEAGIPFSILNEQFSSLYPGPAVGAFAREIVVADEDDEKARELLDGFFKPM